MTLFNTDTAIESLIKSDVEWELDTAFELHETYEKPAWETIQRIDPSLLRWFTPQASLDGLTGNDSSSSWVDFLFCSPNQRSSLVIEIDGNQHIRSGASDQNRDQVLETTGFAVKRFSGDEMNGEEFSDFIKLLSELEQEEGHGSKPSTRPSPYREIPNAWLERSERRGWSVEYSISGGKLRSGDPLDEEINEIMKEKIARLTSQIFIATSESAHTQNSDALYWVTVCQKILQRGNRPFITPRTEELLRSVFVEPDNSEAIEAVSERLLGPAAIHRFGIALIKAIHAGFLIPGNSWNIELEDATEMVEHACGGVLDLLAAVDGVWATGVVPTEISINNTLWRRDGSRFEVSKGSSVKPPDLKIILDPYRPPHASLPTTELPTLVIRSAFLPIKPRWFKPVSNERRNANPDQECKKAIETLLQDLFGHKEFREGQEEAIIRTLSGENTAVMLPTGTGKSLIFQIAGLLRPGVTLIVDPLVSLINDQERGLNDQTIDRVTALTGSRIRENREILKSVGRGDAIFTFLTPERLQIESFREQLKELTQTTLINLVIIDESHCVSEWGHDFRTAYLNVSKNLKSHCVDINFREPPLLALTATASPAVRRDMFRELNFDSRDPDSLQTPSSHERKELHLSITESEDSTKRADLTRIVFEEIPNQLDLDPSVAFSSQGNDSNCIIVFTPHVGGKFGVVKIKEHLEEVARREEIVVNVGYYSGSKPRNFNDNLDWDEYKQAQADSFIKNEICILVATKGFGMGIDKPNIRGTVHFGMPSSVEAFAQEFGRAGRDRKNAYCHLIAVLPEDPEREALLDLDLDLQTRDQNYRDRGRSSTDLDHQLFFHHNSFKGIKEEVANSQKVLNQIWNGEDETIGATTQILETNGDQTEKSLFRLASLGIILDYTKEYKGGSTSNVFNIELARFDSESIDSAIKRRGRELEPGRGATLSNEINEAPENLKERCLHHIELFIKMLYRNIEPARIRALQEMISISTSGLDERILTDRINAYLGDGLFGLLLNDVIESLDETATAEALLTILHEMEHVNSGERTGATARQIENTPDNPIALLALAASTATSETEDLDRFRSNAKMAFANLQEYADEQERINIFESFRAFTSVSENLLWACELWDLWPEEEMHLLKETSDSIIENSEWQDLKELEAIIRMRIDDHATESTRYAVTETES